MFNTMQKQMRQVVLGAMVATATLTGGASPKKTERSSFVPGQKASTYQTAKAPLTGRRGTTSPNRTNARSSKQAPAVQKGKGVTGQAVKTASPGSWQTDPMDAPPQKVSIPWMPELKFSNKFSACPVPEIQNAEYYINEEYLSDKRRYSALDGQIVRQTELLRKVAPYIPDIFYEKSKLPYAERMKFYESPEKKAIMTALKEQFETNDGAQEIWGIPLMNYILRKCDEVLIYGRPLVSLPTETAFLREAVDLCGLTQAGYWMDIQKAKNREFKDIVPEGYDEKEAQEHKKYLSMIKLMYPDEQYEIAIGIRVENPIRSELPYYSKEDFAHLTKEQTDELLDLWGILPPQLKVAPQLDTSKIFKEYLAIKADKTGYMYILNNSHPTNKSQDRLRRAQKLAKEMVVYKRPLALLRAEDYSLDRILFTCQFKCAEAFYRDPKEGKKRGMAFDGPGMYAMEARALQHLGKKFNHPDWTQLGERMMKELPMAQTIEPTEADFARLAPQKRKELKQMLDFLPIDIRYACDLPLYKLQDTYQEIQADQTGYTYILKNGNVPQNISKEQAQKTQKLALEMLIYRRPVVLLRAEDYSLEQIINTCKFHYVNSFYQRQKKGQVRTKDMPKIVWFFHDVEAKALMNLGKKYHHSDWVEFGQRMYNEGQEFRGLVQKHNDTSVIQTHTRVAEQPRDDDKKKRPLPQ